MNLYVAVALLVVAPYCTGEGQSCQGQVDCASDECCTYLAPYRGRRQDAGVCKKRGTFNTRCFTENRFQTEGRYANICPCASGFGCKSLGFMEVPFGEVGTCAPDTKGRREEMESRETHCSSGADCPSGQCCESLFKPIGRRQPIFRAQGVCRPMGTVGSHCYANSVSGKPDQMAFACPCSAGLNCKGSGLFEVPLGEVGTCQAMPITREVVEAREAQCSSGDDCPPDHCCQSRVRPLGRRQLGGICTPMGTLGSGCLTRLKSGKPDGMAFSCPCSTGLHCKGNGFFDIPLGEMGTCEAGSVRRETPEETGDVTCQSGSDCPSDKCCVNLVRSKGRRQLQDWKVCRPMGTAGSSCFANSQPGKLDHVVYACPCSSGLHCKSNGIFDVPLGERGNCVSDAN